MEKKEENEEKKDIMMHMKDEESHRVPLERGRIQQEVGMGRLRDIREVSKLVGGCGGRKGEEEGRRER